MPHSPTHNAPPLTREQVRNLVRQFGFDEADTLALPHISEERDAQRFAEWIGQQRGGSMHYLEYRAEDQHLLRERVCIPFPWAQSVIVLFASYHCTQPRSTEQAPQDAAWIARYAWSSRTDTHGTKRPSDYHKVLLKRLRALEAHLHELYGEFSSRSFVDTGPVQERALATMAGLGWTGKNTCLIHPRLGSYGFLAVLLTSLNLSAEDPITLTPDRCGSCTRCLDACPTGALIAPYQMDARRCISYLTIEHKGPIAPELMEKMGRQVFGCDICQDVCPWNRKAPISTNADLEPRSELVNPLLEWLAAMDETEFERHFNGSPIRRAGFFGLRRNIAIAAGNSGIDLESSKALRQKLFEWENAADEALRTAAQWALKKLLRKSSE